LRAKTMMFDGETMFVGSFNFDQRSLNINNEIGQLFHDPAVKTQYIDLLNERFSKLDSGPV
jgi:cardiolipin synthase C